MKEEAVVVQKVVALFGMIWIIFYLFTSWFLVEFHKDEI